MTKQYPCDSGDCPFCAVNALQCYNLCGLGADEDGEPGEVMELVHTKSRDLQE